MRNEITPHRSKVKTYKGPTLFTLSPLYAFLSEGYCLGLWVVRVCYGAFKEHASIMLACYGTCGFYIHTSYAILGFLILSS